MNNKKLLLITIVISLIMGFSGAGLGLLIYPKIFNVSSQQKTTTEKVTTQDEQAVINTVKKLSPAVVSVVLTRDVPIMEQYWSSPYQFFPSYRQNGTQKQEIGGGSGFIISSDGLILTNKHVVEILNVEYTVVLNNSKKYSAKVLAKDPSNDVAVLKIEERNLPTVELGDSDSLRVGQTVITIGFALGEFPNSVSTGVVSGLGRNITASTSFSGRSESIQGVIQTDAGINEGNSGGPLLNLSGQVVGINTAMATGAENISFAIPINQVKNSVNQVKTVGKISYPLLGVNHAPINDVVKQQYNLSVNYGALVIKDSSGVAVMAGSAAAKAGILENDIILEVDGQKITEKNTLSKMIISRKVGDKIKIKILRSEKELTVEATLQESR